MLILPDLRLQYLTVLQVVIEYVTIIINHKYHSYFDLYSVDLINDLLSVTLVILTLL